MSRHLELKMGVPDRVVSVLTEDQYSDPGAGSLGVKL